MVMKAIVNINIVEGRWFMVFFIMAEVDLGVEIGSYRIG